MLSNLFAINLLIFDQNCAVRKAEVTDYIYQTPAEESSKVPMFQLFKGTAQSNILPETITLNSASFFVPFPRFLIS